MRRVLGSHLGSVHKQLVNLVASVADLLVCFLGLAEDRTRLGVVVAVESFEVRLSVLVTLVDHSDHGHQTWLLLELAVE